MNEGELLESLAKAGLETQGAMDAWSESARLLSALDAIGHDGGIAVVKIDGRRSDSHSYTVVVSGGRLGEQFFRKDGSELRPLLHEAISFYVAHAQRARSVIRSSDSHVESRPRGSASKRVQGRPQDLAKLESRDRSAVRGRPRPVERRRFGSPPVRHGSAS
jgi:hypothetical protein